MNYLLIDGRPGNPYDNELLEMAKHHAFDLFILYLNNIIFPSGMRHVF